MFEKNYQLTILNILQLLMSMKCKRPTFAEIFHDITTFSSNDLRFSFDRLVNWFLDWLIDWFIDWFLDWLIDGLIDWLIDWLVGWLIGWLIPSSKQTYFWNCFLNNGSLFWWCRINLWMLHGSCCRRWFMLGWLGMIMIGSLDAFLFFLFVTLIRL